MTVSLRVPGLFKGSNSTGSSSSPSSESSEEAHVWTKSRLAERATCKTTTDLLTLTFLTFHRSANFRLRRLAKVSTLMQRSPVTYALNFLEPLTAI